MAAVIGEAIERLARVPNVSGECHAGKFLGASFANVLNRGCQASFSGFDIGTARQQCRGYVLRQGGRRYGMQGPNADMKIGRRLGA
jgi:hypothetical protein